MQTVDPALRAEAEAIVLSWGDGGAAYLPSADYQHRLRELLGRFTYRLDTNYAKMDRIVHPELEAFKRRVMAKEVHGLTVRAWERLFRSGNDELIKRTLAERLDIKDGDAETLLE